MIEHFGLLSSAGMICAGAAGTLLRYRETRAARTGAGDDPWSRAFADDPEKARQRITYDVSGGAYLVLKPLFDVTDAEQRSRACDAVHRELGPQWWLAAHTDDHRVMFRREGHARDVEPRPSAAPSRLSRLRGRLDVVMDEWLDYDRDIEALLRRPAMRDYARAPIERCARAILAADEQARTARADGDLDALEQAVGDAEVALAEATLFADTEARRGMSERERGLLTRARAALSLALDTGASEAERLSAYRVVARAMQQLGVPVPQTAQTRVLAAIEARAVPLGELTSSLIVRTPEVILAGLPAAGPTRRVYLDSRVRRAGSSEVEALTGVLRSTVADMHTTSMATRHVLDADRAAITALADAIAEQRRVLADLIACDDAEVAAAAQARMDELADAETNARHALRIEA